MAKRRRRYPSYRRSRRSRPLRRVILLFLFVAAIAAAVWLIWGRPGPHEQAGGSAAVADSDTASIRPAKPSRDNSGGAIPLAAHQPGTGDRNGGSQPARASQTVGKDVQDVQAQPGQAELLRQARQHFSAGMAALKAGEKLKAREELSAALNKGLPAEQEKIIKTELTRLAEQMLFSRRVYRGDELCELYHVRSGELLARIARRYKVPWQLLMRINGLARPELLRADSYIKVIHGPFDAVVFKSRFEMQIWLGDVYVCSFGVGLGQNGSTPTGTWLCTKGGKMINPPYTDPTTGKVYQPDDPANPVGEHWISLQGLDGEAVGRVGFGIHGTIDPSSIGKNLSLGCIRMRNEDVARVFEMLEDGSSKVRIYP